MLSTYGPPALDGHMAAKEEQLWFEWLLVQVLFSQRRSDETIVVYLYSDCIACRAFLYRYRFPYARGAFVPDFPKYTKISRERGQTRIPLIEVFL